MPAGTSGFMKSAKIGRRNHWAPRTRKRHQQEHWPQRPTESSDPTQHAKERTGECPGPVKIQQPDGMSYRGAGFALKSLKASRNKRLSMPLGPL